MVFHRYYDVSIKDGTRRLRGQGNTGLVLAETAKQRKYIPILTIFEHLVLNQTVLQTLLGLHAFTGSTSDTTHYFAGHNKKTRWKTFQQQ